MIAPQTLSEAIKFFFFSHEDRERATSFACFYSSHFWISWKLLL